MTEYIEKTQKELGGLIPAPKLTEKLLSKPPFRFLHDVVTNFIKANKFPEGLYEDAMLDSANVSEKDQKIEFLRLLIAAVEAGTGKTCSASPAKVVAGADPENTNEMLQMLAACASLSADKKKAAVEKAKSVPSPKKKEKKEKKDKEEKKDKGEEKGDKKDKEEKKEKKDKEEKKEKKDKEEKKEKSEEKSDKKDKEEKKEKKDKEEKKEKKDKEEKKEKSEEKGEKKDREEKKEKKDKEEKKEKKDKEEKKEKKSKKDETDEEREKRHEEERKKRHEEKKCEKEKDDRRASAGAVEQTATARKAPPKVKPTHEVVEGHSAVDAAPAAGVIREGKKGEDDATPEATEDWQRIAEHYDNSKPTARTAGVADDAEVRGALGQQALKAKREQEEAKRAQEEAALLAPRDGGIVIRSSKSGTGASGGHVMGDNELGKLREQLQLLTKASNPLGKFLEAIHDDIDSMTRELDMWRSESRSQALAAANARRQTEENLQEIHAQLQNLEDAISDQIMKTNNLRQKILSNDRAVEGMIRMVVAPEVNK